MIVTSRSRIPIEDEGVWQDYSKVQVVEDHMKHQQQVLQLLKENLNLAQNRMKQQADQHCSERTFNVGDWVFLRLQPYK